MCLAVLNKCSEVTDTAGMLKHFIANLPVKGIISFYIANMHKDLNPLVEQPLANNFWQTLLQRKVIVLMQYLPLHLWLSLHERMTIDHKNDCSSGSVLDHTESFLSESSHSVKMIEMKETPQLGIVLLELQLLIMKML